MFIDEKINEDISSFSFLQALMCDGCLFAPGSDRDPGRDGGEHLPSVPEVGPVPGIHSDGRGEPQAEPQRSEPFIGARQARAGVPAHPR